MLPRLSGEHNDGQNLGLQAIDCLAIRPFKKY